MLTRKLKERGLIWKFSFRELENLLQELLTLQGKSERIRRVGKNLFEGVANDVPISSIARGIETDIRQMPEEDKIQF